MLKIGTCGFRSTKEAYAERLSTVEIQHTFYQPPMAKTLESWRAQMPENFEFTLKAWQLITHESSSPTYKRLRRKLTEKESADAGAFRLTPIVKEAWKVTLEAAKALKTRTVLFQCPAKFEPTKQNIANLTKFFSRIDRGDLNFAWEPRGTAWTNELIKRLCADFDLWHAVDPFARATVTPEQCYFRLHGRVRWRYQYEDSELEELATMMPQDKLGYVFFNNITMLEDAERFQRIARVIWPVAQAYK
ncbi:MAG TPA: DUF72 domain-containing protein [Pyrinomonadaceae bacterium]|nr:DUF72 domain-containing protein [Pyrinomonadaceae bacterium]